MPAPTLPVAPIPSEDPKRKKQEEGDDSDKDKQKGKGKDDASKVNDDKKGDEAEDLVSIPHGFELKGFHLPFVG